MPRRGKIVDPDTFPQGLNETAEWDLGGSGHQSTAHGVSFDDAQTLDTQLAFYFAIDQCFAEFVAIFQLDQFLV